MANDQILLGNIKSNQTGQVALIDLVTFTQTAFQDDNFMFLWQGYLDPAESAFRIPFAAGANVIVPGSLDNGAATMTSRTQEGGVINFVNPTSLAVANAYNITNLINTASPAVGNAIPTQTNLNALTQGYATSSSSNGTNVVVVGGNNFLVGDSVTVTLTSTDGKLRNGSRTIVAASSSSWSFADNLLSAYGSEAETIIGTTVPGARGSGTALVPIGTVQYNSASGILGVTYDPTNNGSAVFLLSGAGFTTVNELDFDPNLWNAGFGSGFGAIGLDAGQLYFDQDGLTGWAFENFGSAFAHFNLSPTNFVLTSVATSIGSTAVYTGTITGGAANALSGFYFTVTGFTTGANNIPYAAQCTASTATTLTLVNSAAVNETHAGTATYFITLQDQFGGGSGYWYNSESFIVVMVQDNASPVHYYTVPNGGAFNTKTLYKSHVVGTGGTSAVWNGYMNDDATFDLRPWQKTSSGGQIEGWNNHIVPASDGNRYFVTAMGSPQMVLAVNVDSMSSGTVGYTGFYALDGSTAWTTFMDKNGLFWAMSAPPRITFNNVTITTSGGSPNTLTINLSTAMGTFNPMRFQVGETILIDITAGNNATLDTAVNNQAYFVVTALPDDLTVQAVITTFSTTLDSSTSVFGFIQSQSTEILKWDPTAGVNSPATVNVLTQVQANTPTSGQATYLGTITNGGNTYAGTYVSIAGFSSSQNNGTFLCVSNTNAQMVLKNPNAGNATQAATAATGNLNMTEHRVWSTVSGLGGVATSSTPIFARYLAAAAPAPSGTRAFHPNVLSFGW